MCSPRHAISRRRCTDTNDEEAIVAWWSGALATPNAFVPTGDRVWTATPDAVVAESRRLGAGARRAARRSRLARDDRRSGLDYAYEQLAEHAAEATADAFVDAVAALDTASLPATMLRLTTIPVLYVPARAWLEANFDRALAALASAHDGTSAPSETAHEILRRFARREHAGAVAALARRSAHRERGRADARLDGVRPALGDTAERVPVPRGAPAPFDRDAAFRAWGEGVKLPAWMPRRFAIPQAMKRAEAVFWFFAATSSSAAEVRALDLDRTVTAQDVRERIGRTYQDYYEQRATADVMRALAHLFDAAALIEVILDDRNELQIAAHARTEVQAALACGFCDHVAPFLGAAEFAACGARVRDALQPFGAGDAPYYLYHLAASLAVADALPAYFAALRGGRREPYHTLDNSISRTRSARARASWRRRKCSSFGCTGRKPCASGWR